MILKAEVDRCRSCGAEISWLLNDHTGRRAPIEARPHAEGTITISLLDGTYSVVGRVATGTRDDEAAGEPRYVNHFATCPAAQHWQHSTRSRTERARTPARSASDSASDAAGRR